MSSASLFKDRKEAGQKLAKILEDLSAETLSNNDSSAIVLALPRGGVVVGAGISKALKLRLDIVVTRKIGAPENEEYAIGAIDVDGGGVWNELEIENVDKEWLKMQTEKEMGEARRRQSLYRGERGPLDLKNKTVILVDDGIATGLTMKASIGYVKKLGAKKIVVASPVASKETADEIKREVNEVRILKTPPFFFAVGQFYEDFPQVEDEEVGGIMKEGD